MSRCDVNERNMREEMNARSDRKERGRERGFSKELLMMMELIVLL